MQVQFQLVNDVQLLGLYHRGSYDDISGLFDQLVDWATRNGLQILRTIGIYWDNPDYVRERDLRSAACVQVADGSILPSDASLPVKVITLKGGEYAITTFTGPYEDLAPVWTEFTSYIENVARHRISNEPAYEVYVNDPAVTAPSDLITELHMPVK